MTKRFFFLCLIFFSFLQVAFSKEEESFIRHPEDSTISVQKEDEEEITAIRAWDFHTLFSSLMNQGWGIGYLWEQQFFPHFAMKFYLGHSSFSTGYNEIYCSTISTNVFFEWYPFSKQLRKFYVAIGGDQDYLNYYTQTLDEISGDGAVFSFSSAIGYKISLPLNFAIDIMLGYKWSYYKNCSLYGNATDYVNSGIQYGIYFRHIISRN